MRGEKTFKNVKEVITYLLIILFFPATSPLLMISNVKSLIATVKSCLILCTVREIEDKFISMKLLYGVCANDSNCFDGILSTLLPSVTSTDRCRFFIPAVLGGDDLL